MMVVFTQIKVENFKRFKGEHILPLTGDGPITVIAAENGVGKTTILDAFYLALHGEKGMKQRKQDPAFSFNSWLKNAYSSTAGWDAGFGKISVRLEMNTNEGEVAIERQFWLQETSEEISEETHLYINGKLLSLEAGEHRLQTIRSWIEALFPPAITQRFLIDGEQLGTLDVKHLGQHMKEGLDDVLGQGTLHRLKYHLNGVKRKTIATLAPADERESLERLMEERDQREQDMLAHSKEIDALKTELLELDVGRQELRAQLEMSSDEAGSALGRLRIRFAESNSILANKRKEAMEWMTNDAPFLLQASHLNLETLGHTEAVETLRNSTLHEQVLSVLKVTLENVRPTLKKDVKVLIQEAATEELTKNQDRLPSAFRFLSPESMETFTIKHAVHVEGKQSTMAEFFKNAAETLHTHRRVVRELNEASQRSGMAKIANQLELVSGNIGRIETKIVQLRSDLASMETLQEHDDARIGALRASTSSDSKQQQLIDCIDKLQPILQNYADRRRDQLAEPLSEAFEDGFELLSRKAKRLKHIGVNPEDYHVEIGMAGFSGNWLERDLSATEKQHVGLSLLYALRRQAQTALPVVVDTPTSRMDKRHKGYSVTQFYPKLSHQVIVLATSDDLAGGLYEELRGAKALGQEILLKESGDAEVELEIGSLAHFFEVEG